LVWVCFRENRVFKFSHRRPQKNYRNQSTQDHNLWSICCNLCLAVVPSDLLTFLLLLLPCHGRMNYKDAKPYVSAFLKIDLLTDFAALCLTDFIDWRYIHSVVCIFDPACELLPPWTKELYLCTVVPLLYLLSDLLPSPPLPMYSICRQCVTGGMLNCAGVLTRFRTYKIATPPQTKMTSKDDIKGFVSLKFLSLCYLLLLASLLQYC
jgi:hypothetical protein